MRPKQWPPVTESRAERTAGLREVIGYGKLSVACYCSPPLLACQTRWQAEGVCCGMDGAEWKSFSSRGAAYPERPM